MFRMFTMTNWMPKGHTPARGGRGLKQLFPAKWSSKCSVCGKKIRKGEWIGSYGRGKGAYHKNCAQGGKVEILEGDKD